MGFRQLLLHNCAKNVLVNQIRYSSSCWSCGKTTELIENLFCSNCKVLQKPNTESDYFTIIGITKSFDLDEEELAKRYKQLQRFLHPDKFANKDQKEHEVSEQYSSLVNEAYKTLLEPLTRGIYMLRLHGKDIPENTEVDEEFLMTIMEKNEEVENATTNEEILTLNNEIKSQIKELQRKVSQAFYDGDLQNVIKLLSIMKYYTSIDNQIQAAIREKGIIQ